MLRISWTEKRINEFIFKKFGVHKSYPPYAISEFLNALHIVRKQYNNLEKIIEEQCSREEAHTMGRPVRKGNNR